MIPPTLIQEVVQELPSLITENDLHVSQVNDCMLHPRNNESYGFLSVLVGVAVLVVDDGNVSYGICKKCGCGCIGSCDIHILL